MQVRKRKPLTEARKDPSILHQSDRVVPTMNWFSWSIHLLHRPILLPQYWEMSWSKRISSLPILIASQATSPRLCRDCQSIDVSRPTFWLLWLYLEKYLTVRRQECPFQMRTKSLKWAEYRASPPAMAQTCVLTPGGRWSVQRSRTCVLPDPFPTSRRRVGSHHLLYLGLQLEWLALQRSFQSMAIFQDLSELVVWTSCSSISFFFDLMSVRSPLKSAKRPTVLFPTEELRTGVIHLLEIEKS